MYLLAGRGAGRRGSSSFSKSRGSSLTISGAGASCGGAGGLSAGTGKCIELPAAARRGAAKSTNNKAKSPRAQAASASGLGRGQRAR